MQLNRILSPGKKGVFYGIQNNEKVTLEKQIQTAEHLTKRYNSIIIKEYIDTKKNLLLNNLSLTRNGLLDLMKWVAFNDCDFIVCYDKECLYDDQLGKQKINKFIAANQIPVILCHEETLFHPISIKKTNIPQ